MKVYEVIVECAEGNKYTNRIHYVRGHCLACVASNAHKDLIADFDDVELISVRYLLTVSNDYSEGDQHE